MNTFHGVSVSNNLKNPELELAYLFSSKTIRILKSWTRLDESLQKEKQDNKICNGDWRDA